MGDDLNVSTHGGGAEDKENDLYCRGEADGRFSANNLLPCDLGTNESLSLRTSGR